MELGAALDLETRVLEVVAGEVARNGELVRPVNMNSGDLQSERETEGCACSESNVGCSSSKSSIPAWLMYVVYELFVPMDSIINTVRLSRVWLDRCVLQTVGPGDIVWGLKKGAVITNVERARPSLCVSTQST